MTNEETIELINSIENGAAFIAVREQINGKVGNFYLTELPAELAIRHVCRIIRSRLRKGEREGGAEMNRAEAFARRIVSLISEGNTKETFDADVADVTTILCEFERLIAAYPITPVLSPKTSLETIGYTAKTPPEEKEQKQ